MAKGSDPSYLESLNGRQLEAVLHFGSPLLILAGAGSGKTRVITTKIACLVDQQHFDPRSILAVTFTNKAAKEMKQRAVALAPKAGEVMIRTFHSFGAWLLRRNASLIGLSPYFTICDEQDSLSLLKSAVKEKLPGGLTGSDARRQCKEFFHWISRAKDCCLGPDDDLSSLSHHEDLPEVYRAYQRYLQTSGNVDFGDLILRSVELLQDNPEVRKRISQRFRVVLVDEYQDSNIAQFHLLDELYDKSNYICVVGDEDQSIYRFRGAEMENILNFDRTFPGTTVIRLEENYRSTGHILAAAGSVVKNNRRRLGKNLWTRKEEGARILLAYLEDQEQEARFCSDILKDGNYGNTAILYRMNFQSRSFETLFNRLEIPYRVVGTLRFYEREEVKDALAYLILLLNPNNMVAFVRAIGKPRRGVGERSIDKIKAVSRDRSMDLLAAGRAALDSLKGRGASGAAKFLSLMDHLGERLDVSKPALLIKEVITESGLYDHYRERDLSEGSSRLSNLEELVSALSEYPPGREGLSRYLEDISLNSSDENPYETTPRVTLITVHNTKGLEFERVIITGLEEGIFPLYPGMEESTFPDEEELEEERRLFYVAITRARERLVLTTCATRKIFGRERWQTPSMFLDEVPAEIMDAYGQNSEEEDFPLGCGVFHEQYGSGIITKKWMHGSEPMVVVRFENGRSARFCLNYTHLERIAMDEWS
ncbi:MAG: AAA family ATPase [Spirochaeta sp.]|nr:AAA family ATPase [Spirochaeta sp.]